MLYITIIFVVAFIFALVPMIKDLVYSISRKDVPGALFTGSILMVCCIVGGIIVYLIANWFNGVIIKYNYG